jgi:hypothetical protein
MQPMQKAARLISAIKLQLSAIDIYIHDFSTIGYIIQDLVAFIFLKKQRLHLRILIESSECDWGETDNGLHPYTISRKYFQSI